MGKLIADYIVGAESSLLSDVQSLPTAGLLPPAPVTRYFVGRRLRAALDGDIEHQPLAAAPSAST